MTTPRGTPRHEGAEAWHLPPGAYRERRERDAAIGAPTSRYLTMRDGCRLAVDLYLPERLDGTQRPVPTILILTPYYRRFRLTPGSTSEPSPNAGKYRDAFVPYGYAVLVVDTRGTGASFGTRDSFRSPREREDSREIADWIVAQPWSDGRIGATGISYLGAGADFLATTGHPAVKAIGPICSVWDTYADNYYPGGILLTGLTRVYDALMVAMDHDRRDLLRQFSYFADPTFDGPQPVDDDPDGVLVREAVREHLGNFRQTDFMAEFRFRDDALPYDPAFTSASFSPYSLREQIRPDVAIYSMSGWYDGAGYANGAIARHLTLSENPRHLLLGPWDHGARIDVSPWRRSVEPSFPWLAELLRFFDHYLMGRETGLDREAPVHTFCLHAEAWHAAEGWPASGTTLTFGFEESGGMTPSLPLPPPPPFGQSPSPYGGGDQAARVASPPPPQVGSTRLGHSTRPNSATAEVGGEGDHAQHSGGGEVGTHLATLQVDFAWGSGTGTRYERIAGIDSRDYYADWTERVARLAGWESEAFTAATILTGHALVDLTLASSEPDAALFVYLSEIEQDGRARYITEGLLRALHRAEAPCPPAYRASWPFRTFARADARPLVPGRFERIRIPCLPVSWQIAAGSRLRVSIAGTDADHCGQVPHGRPPALTLDLAKCRVELPIVV